MFSERKDDGWLLPLFLQALLQRFLLDRAVSAYIDSQKQANITILNKSGKGIQGFAVSSGNFMDITDNGLLTDNPNTIIVPDAKYTIQIPLSDLKATVPVVIFGVLYDDSTEAVDETVRKKMHDARLKEKERRLSTSK